MAAHNKSQHGINLPLRSVLTRVLSRCTKKMNFTYPEGEPIKIGDFVWLNEGSMLGFVIEILTDPKDYKWLDDSHIHSPRICFSDLYPYEAIQKLDEIKGGSGGGSCNYWIYDYTDFEDEGIGLVESKYKEDFERAIFIAKKI